MGKKIVIKAVAFNILDVDQKQLLDHAMMRTNFSAYIKRLIQRDMEGVAPQAIVQQNTFEVDRDIANGLI